MVTELLEKYIWLIQKLINASDKGLSLREISDAWERKSGSPYPRRSFNNHREDIAEIFGIEIECDRSSNRYFIRNSSDISDSDSSAAWLIDTFTVNNMLSLAKDRLSGRISVEAVPSGRKHLTPLMNAMQESNIVEIGYRKYGSSSSDIRRVHPYGIKEASLRWYLVGWTEQKQDLRVYALDRIESMKILPETFDIPQDFDIDALFASSFGPYLSDGHGRKIEFRAYGNEASYIQDLPLHHTQEIVKKDDKSTTFSIFASPNIGLYLEFLGHGSAVEVLSPQNVRQEMKRIIGLMAKLYE